MSLAVVGRDDARDRRLEWEDEVEVGRVVNWGLGFWVLMVKIFGPD